MGKSGRGVLDYRRNRLAKHMLARTRKTKGIKWLEVSTTCLFPHLVSLKLIIFHSRLLNELHLPAREGFVVDGNVAHTERFVGLSVLAGHVESALVDGIR